MRLADEKEFYESCKENMAVIRDELRWEKALKPLVEFCRNGKSIAATKRQRVAPLIRHVIGYLQTHVRQNRIKSDS